MALEVDSTVVLDLDHTCSSCRLAGLASPGTAGVPPALVSYSDLSDSTLVASPVSPPAPETGGTSRVEKSAGPT